jgi:hypothetical protein
MDQQFPKFLLLFGNERRFLSILEAQMVRACGGIATEVVGLSISADSSVRDMTPEERARINAIFTEKGPADA